MKYLFVTIITILSLTQCKTTRQTDDGVNTLDELQIERSTTVNIKGNWTLIKTEIIKEKQSIARFVESSKPYIGKEAIPPVYKNNNGLLKPHSEVTYFSEVMKDMAISEDSILGMNYPLELLQRISYSIEGNLIQIETIPSKNPLQ